MAARSQLADSAVPALHKVALQAGGIAQVLEVVTNTRDLEVEFIGRPHMHRSCLLIPVLLFISAPVFAQSSSTDSQTLQALLAEVRQLHHDLQSTTIAVHRAQILLYHLQGQEAIVARASQRLDDARARLAETQNNRIKSNL